MTEALAKLPKKPSWPLLLRHYPRGVLLHTDMPFEQVRRRVAGRMVYLATPYTRAVVNRDGEWDRVRSSDIEGRTARWSRLFALNGVTAVSPIVLACAICHSDLNGLIDPLDDPFWAKWCQPMLSAAGAVVIPPMWGWEESRGVWREAVWALAHNVPVYLIRPGTEYGVAK